MAKLGGPRYGGNRGNNGVQGKRNGEKMKGVGKPVTDLPPIRRSLTKVLTPS